MLRMVLLGLLIPLGVGVLAAMELRTPPRNAAVAVQPLAELTVGISEPRGALAKADQLEKADQLVKADRPEIAAASSETPARPALVEERISPPQGIRALSSEVDTGSRQENAFRFHRNEKGSSVGSAEPPRVINRHRHDPKSKKVTAAASARSKPKQADVKRAAISEQRKAAGNTQPCRLSAFGGLLKALGSADCEI